MIYLCAHRKNVCFEIRGTNRCNILAWAICRELKFTKREKTEAKDIDTYNVKKAAATTTITEDAANEEIYTFLVYGEPKNIPPITRHHHHNRTEYVQLYIDIERHTSE